MLDQSLVRIDGLRVTFRSRTDAVAAVKDLSFDVKPGEVVCLVGESGSGKSVSALSLMRLVEFSGGQIEAGRLLWQNEAGAESDLAQRRDTRWRGREIGMIFQEPATALNPVLTIGSQLTEGLRYHERLGARAARARALALLRQVRIAEPERRLRQYPHELSGGMRQR
ncbi:MAG: ATP-binding cassette domain-containing protein, partial [Pseudomonadota bacterium]